MSAKQSALSKPAPAPAKKPASRKPAAKPGASVPIAHIGPAPHVIAETIVQLVPYPLLGRAPENVRHTRQNEDVTELADDIAAHGLLQSLIGYQDPSQTIFPNGYTWIVGGGRRLAALALLHTRGIIDDDYRVPVVVRDEEDAIELSLAENLARRNMSPVDEFLAFEQLMRPGTTSAAELAKRFGFSERYVKQRLRLAGLAEVVLDALRERKITLDAAIAYAGTEDASLQAEIFKKQSKSPYDPHSAASIRRDLNNKAISTTNPLFKFVGELAWRAAGGGFEDDLFNEVVKEERTLSKPFLLADLVREKIASDRFERLPQLVAETPSLIDWIEVPDLRIFSWGTNNKPTAPDGFVLVDKWDFEPVWNTIRNNNIPAYVAVGIDDAGDLVTSPRIVYVPKGQLEAVVGKPQQAQEPVVRDWQAERRENDVQQIQWQFAARGVLGPDWASDEIVYPRGVDYVDAVEESRRPDLAHGKLVAVQVFVTQEQFEAQRDLAVAAHAGAAGRIAAALAMKPEPAVVVADYVAFYRWEDGSYRDVIEGSDGEPDRLLTAGSLADLLDEAGDIGPVCATLQEYADQPTKVAA